MSTHVFYVLLHPLGAGLFHMLEHIPIDIQRKCRRSVAQVSLHRFHIVAVLEGQHCIGMPLWHNKDNSGNPFGATG